MSTIDPSLVDPTKPETGEASTAVERSQRQVVQDQFTAAKTDIEGLEAGKEPAGSVATHDASGAAHGGVQSDFAAHKGAGGAEHAAVTGVANGFMVAADKTKLDGVEASANNYSHPNHTGDVTSVGDGAQTIAADAVTNAKLANMAANTVKLRVATTGDPTDSTITGLADHPTPGAGDELLAQKAGGDLVKIDVSNLPSTGGGIAKGAPFTLDEILFVSNAGGDGQANTRGIKQEDITMPPGTTVVDNLMAWNATDGTASKDSLVPTAQVARRDQANTFGASPQVIETTAESRLELYRLAQVLQSGRFRFESSGGFLTFSSLNDAGTPVGDINFSIAHNNSPIDGAIFGSVAFPGAGAVAAENGFYDGTDRTLSPGRAAAITGTIGYSATGIRQLAGGTSETVDPQTGNYVEITGSTGTTTLTAGANIGTVVYYVPSGVTIGLTGFIVGSGSKADPGSGVARLCICTQGPINRASFD